MKRAKIQRGGDEVLQKYIDNMLSDAHFRRVSHLPSALERKLYYDIIRTTMQVRGSTTTSFGGPQERVVVVEDFKNDVLPTITLFRGPLGRMGKSIREGVGGRVRL